MAPRPKPVLNIEEVELDSVPPEGRFAQRYGIISDHIGAQRLGYNLTVVPPGKAACPLHSHHVGEELFFILEGVGTLRFGGEEYPLRAMDCIACPPGGPEVAHQIVNTGDRELKYLAIGTRDGADICEYPASGKVGVTVGGYDKPRLRGMFRIDQSVPYTDGEV